MATQIKLLSQYNRRQKPMNWGQFFGVVSKKDSYHVAVTYTPDNFIQTLESTDYIEAASQRKISSYDFDDNSFVQLAKALSRFSFRVRDVSWTDSVKEHLSDLIDFDDPETGLNFESTMSLIQSNLSIDLQGVQAISLVDNAKTRIEITRFGVVNIRSVATSNLQKAIEQVLL